MQHDTTQNSSPKLGQNTATAAPRALPPWLLDVLSKNGMPQDSFDDEDIDLLLKVAEESGESVAAHDADLWLNDPFDPNEGTYID